jgi:hypothetical protein
MIQLVHLSAVIDGVCFNIPIHLHLYAFCARSVLSALFALSLDHE